MRDSFRGRMSISRRLQFSGLFFLAPAMVIYDQVGRNRMTVQEVPPKNCDNP
jgi:hypothetical protein